MAWNEIERGREYPQSIICVDADAFFASVAQATEPRYKGKPVVTGAERGIIAAVSYEAKALGIQRGISLLDARKKCPQLIVLPTDYETCSLFSKRMFTIMRRFSPLVEEYSIDEGFVDITGLRRTFHRSYEQIAQQMKSEIERELGITVSLGLSLTKTLAKICSSFKKPSGFTAVPGQYIDTLLTKIALEKVCGIGHNTAALLRKHGIKNALDYIRKPDQFYERLIGKLGVEMWQELNGRSVYRVDPEQKQSYQSIMKSKTFSPTTRDREILFAHLLRNLESACIKARRYQLACRRLTVILRTQEYKHFSYQAKLTKASSHTLELTDILKTLYDKAFLPGPTYRASGVLLGDLIPDDQVQLNLFEDRARIDRIEQTSELIDEINHKFGKHTVHLASSLDANQQHSGQRGDIPLRKDHLFKGENKRQRVHLPVTFSSV